MPRQPSGTFASHEAEQWWPVASWRGSVGSEEGGALLWQPSGGSASRAAGRG